jgi:predicted ATPase
MIKKIEVKGLFGAFDHPINIKYDSGITLILAENGLGKTVILRLIKFFFQKNFSEMQTVIFSEFIIWMVNGDKISIKKTTTEKDDCIFLFKFTAKGKKLTEYTLNFSDERSKRRHGISERELFNDHFLTSELEYFLKRNLSVPLERVAENRWLNVESRVLMSTSEVIERYSRFLPNALKVRYKEPYPDWLINITNSCNIKFIETQRLLTKKKADEYSFTVEDNSKELTENIRNKRAAAIDLASKLDRTYPNRLIEKVTERLDVSDIELEFDFSALEKKRQLLNEVGLIDTEEEYIQPISEKLNAEDQSKNILKHVFKIYIDDSNAKLSIYDDLALRIKLLMDIINKRFLYKKLSINKTNGFVFTSSITGKNMPLSGLSSGEQHELVLFYQLLFNTENGSLLLIDEPEISLHISWQNEFINDLREIIKLNNLSAIIATHSPDIIGKYWDLTVQLKGVNL